MFVAGKPKVPLILIYNPQHPIQACLQAASPSGSFNRWPQCLGPFADGLLPLVAAVMHKNSSHLKVAITLHNLGVVFEKLGVWLRGMASASLHEQHAIYKRNAKFQTVSGFVLRFLFVYQIWVNWLELNRFCVPGHIIQMSNS